LSYHGSLTVIAFTNTSGVTAGCAGYSPAYSAARAP
jgi:hypothetical protein